MMEDFVPKNRVIIQNMPTLPYAIEEAVNRLRVNVSFLGSEVRKIMVISSMPDEGKSFVAMQLWRQMAEANVKSILLDMDLRKSVMVDKYQIRHEEGEKIHGMSYYLANDVSLEDCVLRTNILRIYNKYLPTGEIPAYEFETLSKDYHSYADLEGNSFIKDIWKIMSEEWKVIPNGKYR